MDKITEAKNKLIHHMIKNGFIHTRLVCTAGKFLIRIGDSVFNASVEQQYAIANNVDEAGDLFEVDIKEVKPDAIIKGE